MRADLAAHAAELRREQEHGVGALLSCLLTAEAMFVSQSKICPLLRLQPTAGHWVGALCGGLPANKSLQTCANLLAEGQQCWQGCQQLCSADSASLVGRRWMLASAWRRRLRLVSSWKGPTASESRSCSAGGVGQRRCCSLPIVAGDIGAGVPALHRPCSTCRDNPTLVASCGLRDWYVTVAQGQARQPRVDRCADPAGTLSPFLPHAVRLFCN